MSNYINVNTEYFNVGLEPLEILLLATIESLVRDGKQCYYTNEQLTQMFHVSLTYLKKTLDGLEKKNYIKRNTKVIKDREGKFTRQRTIELVHLKSKKNFEFSF